MNGESLSPCGEAVRGSGVRKRLEICNPLVRVDALRRPA